MPDFSLRSTQEELMDDLNCSGQVMVQTLKELDVINKWLGGNKVTVNGFNKLVRKSGGTTSLHVADLGCGSGEMMRILAQQKNNSSLRFTGIDANPNIVAAARDQVRHYPQIKVQTENILSENFSTQKYDVVLATLFLHHFTKEQLINILKGLKQNTNLGIVVNDLHRHPLAFYSILWLTKLFSKSPMVQADAPRSVLRGFKRAEWVNILDLAGIKDYELKWKWAFRWQLVIYTHL